MWSALCRGAGGAADVPDPGVVQSVQQGRAGEDNPAQPQPQESGECSCCACFSNLRVTTS